MTVFIVSPPFVGNDVGVENPAGKPRLFWGSIKQDPHIHAFISSNETALKGLTL